MDKGVIYVAYGKKAKEEARQSIASLKKHHDWPIHTVTEKDLPDRGEPGRWAKVSLNLMTPYEYTLFLDADTRVKGDLSVGFGALANGWEIVMVPSGPQENEALGHLLPQERAETVKEFDFFPLQLNTGVIWFRKTERLHKFFEQWRQEWLRWKSKDQGAFLRALNKRPVSILLLGKAFNGGDVVEH
ncbi:MAG: hypothetical protein GWN93_09695, partial [Deltaproteobacteria bacterium]|nr:hypothetical protein [Deltaproteobacteria bacterium]